MVHPPRRPRLCHRTRGRAQSLTELALVMPVLVGVIAVLFQLGITFMSYLAIVHSTRDVGRWLAVHPDTTDANALQHVRDNAPSVIDSARLTLTLDPPCASLASNRCSARAAGTALRVTMNYDAAASFFLPSQFRLGPFLNVTVPTALPAYDYYVMIEPH